MNTTNKTPPIVPASECHCGKEFRPIAQNVPVVRCVICGALHAAQFVEWKMAA